MSRIDEALRRVMADGTAEPEKAGSVIEEYPNEHRPNERRQVVDGNTLLLGTAAEHDAAPLSAATLGVELPAGLMRHYQRVAGVMHDVRARNPLKTVAIASAASGEGKTTTLLGLALALTRANSSRVLLVDANLHQPRLHDAVHIQQGPGVIDVISGERHKALPVVLHPSLHVLLAGRASTNPAADLGSEKLRALLQRCAAHYDWVLVDTPAAAQLQEEADVLGRLTDGVVFVIGATTPFAVAERAMAKIGADRILATVLDGLADPL